MSQHRFRPLGFVLAFSALLAFVFHPNHQLIENGSETFLVVPETRCGKREVGG